jgi:hypothetical protein
LLVPPLLLLEETVWRGQRNMGVPTNPGRVWHLKAETNSIGHDYLRSPSCDTVAIIVRPTSSAPVFTTGNSTAQRY